MNELRHESAIIFREILFTSYHIISLIDFHIFVHMKQLAEKIFRSVGVEASCAI